MRGFGGRKRGRREKRGGVVLFGASWTAHYRRMAYSRDGTRPVELPLLCHAPSLGGAAGRGQR